MHQNFLNVKNNFFLVLIAVFLIFSCQKQKDNVSLYNSGVGFDGISLMDSLTLKTYSIKEDSLKTDSVTYSSIGKINESDFGNYSSNTFFDLNLDKVGNVISDKTLDSVVLFIQYTSNISHYGDLETIHQIDVVELQEKLTNSKKYSNSNINYNPTPIGSFVGKLNTKDSISIRNLGDIARIPATMKIKMSSDFANKIFNANATNLASQENFKTFLNGIGLIVKTNVAINSGSIVTLNLKASNTRLRVYFNGDQQSDFVFTDDNKKLSIYEVNNQSNQLTIQRNGTFNFDTGYVQSLTGSKLKIEIPFLFSILSANKILSISKAELIIRPVQNTFNSTFPLPKRLLLGQPNPTTKANAGIIDWFSPFFGGDLINNSYTFNITRHIQSIYTDKANKNIDNNKGFYLYIPSDNPSAPSRIYVDTRKGIKNAGIEFKLYFNQLN